MTATIDPAEIAHFAKDSSAWWDEHGPFRPLHRLNPVRMAYIRDRLSDDQTGLRPLEGLSILDIGCGGGIVCEPLARMGAKVTGMDADENAIATAQEHARQNGLSIDYIAGDADGHKKQYDAVLALEIVEHVADIDAFINICAARVKPGGTLIMSTLNRTPKSFLLGIVAAEYVLRWVPQGTHKWNKFVRPSTLSRALRARGLNVTNITGLVYNPVKDEFSLSATDIDVNYLLTAEKN